MDLRVSRPLRLLLVEDNAGDARLTRSSLQRMPPPMPEVTHVTSLHDAEAALTDGDFDIILTDLDLPDSERLDTCTAMCAAARGMPVVVLTGSHDDALGIEAIAAGAQDYLIKGEFHVSELRRALHHAKERQRLTVAVQEAKRATDEALSRLRSLEEMRERLVHMLVHDLRSPLFGMRLYLESFLRDAGESVPEDLVEVIAKTFDLTGNLVEMVSSILDIHRIESGNMPMNMTRCDLRRLTQDAIDQIAGRAGRVSIRMEVASTIVVCDGTLIRRALANLIANALRFSPTGKPVVVSLAPAGSMVEMRVRDEGPGIPAASQQRVFEKFGSLESHAQGYSTGLGLPFCKIVVELHGGDIGVRSAPGEGSLFWFTLPASGAAVLVGAHESPPNAPP